MKSFFRSKTVAAFLISIIFIYLIIFLLLILISNYLKLETTGDIFSLGELLVEIFLIPIGVIGFILTVSEIRKSQNHFFCW